MSDLVDTGTLNAIDGTVRRVVREESQANLKVAEKVRAEVTVIRAEQARQGAVLSHQGAALRRLDHAVDGNGQPGLKDRVPRLETAVAKVTLDVAELKTGVADLNGGVGELKGLVEGLRASLESEPVPGLKKERKSKPKALESIPSAFWASLGAFLFAAASYMTWLTQQPP